MYFAAHLDFILSIDFYLHHKDLLSFTVFANVYIYVCVNES